MWNTLFILTNRCTVCLNWTWQFWCTDYYVVECVKCIQVQVSDQKYNFADWYVDYLLQSACVTLTSWEFTINQQVFEPTTNPCYVDNTFMDTSEGIKTDLPDMESIYCCSNYTPFWNYVLSLYRRCKMFTWVHYLLTHCFWMSRAVLWAEQSIFFISNKF